MRTQVCIIGGGPSGLLLSHLLHLSGIDSVVLERQPRDHVLSKIRAAVLEWGTVGLLEKAGAARRVQAEGIPQDGIRLSARNRSFRIDFQSLIGRRFMIYSQTELTRDLYDLREAAEGKVIHEVQGAALHDIGGAPYVTYVQGTTEYRVDCDLIVGCDGHSGVSRASVPRDKLHSFERKFPFGWLGILAETPPASNELIYANHPRGFALCALRNDQRSRYYIQVPIEDSISRWTDAAFWDELRRRLPEETAEALKPGAAVEKTMVPMRAFIAEPMRFGQLFLVGDAAHMVPPTGAKGLNLAASDVHYLHEELVAHYGGDKLALDRYSPRALARVWQAMRFSTRMTSLLHRFPGQDDFDQRLQEAELAYLETSTAAQTELAESYAGVPL